MRRWRANPENQAKERAYQREYMREYMRERYAAKRKAEGKPYRPRTKTQKKG